MSSTDGRIEQLTTTAEVQGFADEARSQGRVALDTEFLWERTYAPVPCLVQVATTDRLAVIDPLQGGDIGPIAQLVADPEVELLMHAPSADVLLFARRFSVRPTRVFDVQVLAGFVGFGASLAYDRLVERVLGVRLRHNETFTTWAKRPLSPTQIAYAADDVRHLHAIADRLAVEIEARGRTAWARDELERRYGAGIGEPDPRRAYLKVQRRGRLTGRELAVLREVAAWREVEAQTQDLPVGWIMKDPTAIEIARRMPRDAAAIARVRGAERISGKAVAGLVRAIATGSDAEPIEPPPEPSRDVARRIDAASDLAGILLRVRCDEAELAPELVATRAELEGLVAAMVGGAVDTHPLTEGWRNELVGAEIRELVEGRIAIASRASAPYVEIMRRLPEGEAVEPHIVGGGGDAQHAGDRTRSGSGRRRRPDRR